MGDLDNPELEERMREIGLHSEEAEDIMREFAAEVASAAKGIAPRRTGKMASRIRSSVSNSVGGISGKVTAPAPANLLATRTGIRWQTRAWGHVVRLPHLANRPFLKMAYREVHSVFETHTPYGDDE
jgi:hypothetical protein